MDIISFIAEAIKALAWPITIIVIVLMLKRPILELLPSLRHLKYKELELKFSDEIRELETKISDTVGEEELSGSVLSEKMLNLFNLVSYSPRAAIMEAWIEVESVAASVASSFWGGSSTEVFKNMPKLGEYLLQCKVIDEGQLEVFNKLRQLRNQAAHAGEFNLTEKDAKSYVKLASFLAEHLKEVQ